MLDLAFITSSRIKRAHAIHLCRNYDLTISGQRNYGVGYNEPRIRQRESLLEQSIQDALKRWKKNVQSPDKFFFIGDTSVIIHALSKPENEVPGVDIKYWMHDHNFSDIDKLLKEHGNDRSVTVRSDILLTLPQDLQTKLNEKYVRFTSFSEGRICSHEFNFPTNTVYPWLDNKTFNKWFVPNSFSKPISMLDIDEADLCDFRAGAFNEMLNFLVANGKLKQLNKDENPPKQLGLKTDKTLFLVSGPTCAGKTTLAEYLIQAYGYYHVEASDFMYLSYYQMHGVSSSVKIRDFAHDILKTDPAIVVRQIIKHLEKIGAIPVVITGFRSPNEVEQFKEMYSGSDNIEIVYVEAPSSGRFDRYVKRDRGGQTSKLEFEKENNRQNEMGLKDIGKKYCDDHLYNDSTFDDFYSLFKSTYSQDTGFITSEINSNEFSAPTQLEDAILISMHIDSEPNKYRSTTDISKLISEVFKAFSIVKNKNNISRYFNQSFKPYYEIEVHGNSRKYKLSQTGHMHAKWLMRVKKERKETTFQHHKELGGIQPTLFE